MKRRICWPNPQLTCLEGGCESCNSYHFRSLAQIQQWSTKRGPTYRDAFRFGEAGNWFKAEAKL